MFCLISVACDISITAALWYLLHETRSGIPSYVPSALKGTPHADLVYSTDSIVDILSVQAISRGAVTRYFIVLLSHETC
jgi:hypothetical protein